MQNILFFQEIEERAVIRCHLPSNATTLHMIGQCDVVAPHIELPFA